MIRLIKDFFLRKFFNPFWSLGYLIYRIITFKSIFKSIIAFLNTFFLKRVDLESILFSNTNLKLKNTINFNHAIKQLIK